VKLRKRIASQLLTWFSYLFDALDIGTSSVTAASYIVFCLVRHRY
jgi:hypothetical protein